MTDTNSTPVEAAPSRDPARTAPGEHLRKLREEKGLTYAQVGSALHLTVHYIKALEGDEYGKLPGLTFVKGYLRAYARFLATDVDNVIARFDEHIAGLLDEGRHTARVQRSRRRQDQALRWAIGAGFVVVAGLVAGWWFMSEGETPPAVVTQTTVTQAVATQAVATQRTIPAQQTTAISSPAPTTTAVVPPRSSTVPISTYPAPTANASTPAPTQTVLVPEDTTTTEPAPAVANAESTIPTVTPNANGARQVSLVSAGNDELRVTFNGNSWIEVDDGRLVRLYNDMLSAGDTLTIRGEAPFHVLLGDASRVSVSVNATAIDISADIRDDSTARLTLNAPVVAEVRP